MTRLYEVISDEKVEHGGGWYDPPEVGCDWALVEAETAQQARWAAARYWEDKYGRRSSTAINRLDGVHPLSGVKVVRLSAEDGAHLAEIYDVLRAGAA